MKILIDLQGAQSDSRNRGIGRYSLALATAMARNAGDHELHVLLNGNMEDSIDPIKEKFGDTLPENRFHFWKPVRTEQYSEDGDSADERIREAYITSLRPDVLHVSSLFEGMNTPAITSIGVFNPTIPTAVTLFDLIPLIYPQPYLSNPYIARWYFGKLDHLRRADLILGISSSATNEARQYLGCPEEQAVNISSAIDDVFQMTTIHESDELALRSKFGLNKPFVLYTGGIDHRKNMSGLIRSFAALPVEVRSNYQLAIVCKVWDQPREEMMTVARDNGLDEDDLVLTGYVSEEELVKLYNLCSLFVFPSWHEGFGLPALEAMACGAPVIASNCSSLPEVVGLKEALFDPMSDMEMSGKILAGLTDKNFRERLLANSAVQAKKFSWDNSARKAIGALEGLVEQRKGRVKACELPHDRPRLAYVSPFPPEKSGIADYSAELVSELSRHYDIDVVVAQDLITDMQVVGTTQVRKVDWFRENWSSYDRIVYHMGNSQFHVHMVDLIKRIPGVLVLHDFFLSGMYAHMEFALQMEAAWAKALYASHGYSVLPLKVATAHEKLIVDYPCNFEVVDSALGVIVHSDYSKRLGDEWYGPGFADDWVTIPLLRSPSFAGDDARYRALSKLKLPADAFITSSFGFLAPSKCNHELLRCWFESELSSHPNSFLVFVGQAYGGEYGESMKAAIAAHPAGERVIITGYADQETYQNYLLCSDIAVQLRTASRGETSAAVLDALKHGVATIVNSNGSMADLPQTVVLAIADEFEDAELVRALNLLQADEQVRKRYADAGRKRLQEVHSPRRCANLYAEAIEEFYSDSRYKTQGLTAALAGLVARGQYPADEQALGRALAWALPGRRPARQVLLDISDVMDDKRERERIKSLILYPGEHGTRIEPVRWSSEIKSYVYARAYAAELIGLEPGILIDSPIDVTEDDMLVWIHAAPDTDRSTSVIRRGGCVRSLRDWLSQIEVKEVLQDT
ncbi:glycosyltransferase [Pseudoxanthomonas dokdonensis]|uniref:glycosyltransferase n=1 Tax=Pseudoxanthomonas dokdonensis TaxID=344882 RepID=UPI00070FDDD6|nr:glycosyltransferase [Pseudoxanthomonas dokdonensis]